MSQQAHITSDTMINPSDTRRSLGAAQIDQPPVEAPPFQSGHESEVQKLKANTPRKHSASPQRRTTRTSDSHENNAEHSPLSRHHQARFANKVGGFSPSLERKAPLEGGHGVASNTPGRSPLRSEGGTAVPKFGDWDENNPSTGEGFTGIFKKVSEERQTSAIKVPMFTDDSAYLNSYHHDTGSNKSIKCCCFNWGRKGR